jgi:hypothetical protein
MGTYWYILLSMAFLTRVCSALGDKGVRYALVGGHAVALHGAVRGTVDVDIALTWNLKSLLAAEQALIDIGLTSRLPITGKDVFQFREEYINNRNLIGWNFFNPANSAEQVDIVITYDLKGKKVANIDTVDGPLRLLGRRDLIDMKRASGRPQDLADVAALEKL